MAVQFTKSGLMELWRYYQVGLLNTAFGIAAYSLLVWLGMNMFIAQACAHVAGVTFNYYTYSAHVFRHQGSAKVRFILSYSVNYLANLGVLAGLSRFISSPYIAGIATVVVVSILNYFVLKHLVFNKKIVS